MKFSIKLVLARMNFKQNRHLRLTAMRFKTRFILWFFGISLLSVGGVQASDLQEVNFASLPGDRTEISLTFSEVPSIPL